MIFGFFYLYNKIESYFFFIITSLSLSGNLFGPYFHDDRVTSESYHSLLSEKVFPDMKKKLGVRKFQSLIWQQDGAPCHMAIPVMDYLDGIFGDHMLALKNWAPHSPD